MNGAAGFVSKFKSPEFRNYITSTHFWGPLANWGFVLAFMPHKAIMDMDKPAEAISGPMTSAMCVYSALFMRFAWMVQPRNYLLLACHASNETAQLYLLQKKLRHNMNKPE